MQTVPPGRRYTHIFGPVLSRRLGRSLGVDIMPFKTCTYDCLYCEQGRTTNHTARRAVYVSCAEVLDELKHFLSSMPEPDYITLSGAGEPTLHAELGDLVQGIKAMTGVPLAVITNGSLLWDVKVRDGLKRADVVLPSLDAGNARLFTRINRPVPDISFDQMLGGLMAFRESFPNEMWLEVMLMDGITSGDSEVREIAEQVRRFRPNRIQLNTVVRPPAEPSARPIPRARLESLAAFFEPRAEPIADYAGAIQEMNDFPDADRLLKLLERRPCSLMQIAATLGLRPVETSKIIEHLAGQNKIVQECFGNCLFFSAAHKANEEESR